MFSFSRYREGTFSQEIYALLFGRKKEVREPFLHLVFLDCLHLKVIKMRKWHIWGWHVPNPCSVLAYSCFPGLCPCPTCYWGACGALEQSARTSVTPTVITLWLAPATTKNLLFPSAGCPHPSVTSEPHVRGLAGTEFRGLIGEVHGSICLSRSCSHSSSRLGLGDTLCWSPEPFPPRSWQLHEERR